MYRPQCSTWSEASLRPASSRVIPTRRHMSARSDSRRSTRSIPAWRSWIGRRRDRGHLERPGPGCFQLGDDVVRNPAAEDEPFEQAVGGQAIGAVQARAGHLAGRPEALHASSCRGDRRSLRRSCNERRGRPESGRA